jgi:hypothetical protein
MQTISTWRDEGLLSMVCVAMDSQNLGTTAVGDLCSAHMTKVFRCFNHETLVSKFNVYSIMQIFLNKRGYKHSFIFRITRFLDFVYHLVF